MSPFKESTRSIPFNEKIRLMVIAFLIIFFFFFPLIIHNEFYKDILILTLIFAIASQAWNILGGYGGQISLGHCVFFGIGAYTSTLLYIYYGLTPWVGMILGGVVASVSGALVFYPSFKLRGTYFTLATIAFGQILWLLSIYWRELTFGGTGAIIENRPSLHNFIFTSKIVYYYITLGFLIAVTLVSYLIKESRLGYQLIALREEEDAAESLGIPTTKNKVLALVVSAFFSAIAGTCYAQYQLYIHPDAVFSLGISIQFALISAIGGIGTIFGPILGSLLIVPSDSLFRAWLGSRWAGAGFVIYGILLIIMVRFFPRGFVGFIGRGVKDTLDVLANRLFRREETEQRKQEFQGVITSILGEHAVRDSTKETRKILEVENLSKNFAGVAAVSALNFYVLDGERLGIIGPNGAGKTTLFNLITGFMKMDSGSIFFEKQDLSYIKRPHQACKKGIGRTFQVVKPFPELTVQDNLIAAASVGFPSIKVARNESLRMLEFVRLQQFRNHIARDLPIGALKQLELGRALLTKPKMLMLDEVMGGLNPTERASILSLIGRVNDTGVTILLIEHIMRVIMSISQRIIVLDHGVKIADGTPSQISMDRRVIEAYLGKEYIDAKMS